MKCWALVVVGLLATALAQVPELEEGYEHVTCASVIKLGSSATGYRLHSHNINYGTGSQQQSVTGFPNSDDANSFWIVRAGLGQDCKRGQPIPCNSLVRLQHMNTKGYLHSHHHASPLSHQQEVSVFPNEDALDNWKVICANPKAKTWIREDPVLFQHSETGVYLATNSKHQYGHPIPGQLEIAGVKKKSAEATWESQEGVYFASW